MIVKFHEGLYIHILHATFFSKSGFHINIVLQISHVNIEFEETKTDCPRVETSKLVHQNSNHLILMKMENCFF